MMAKPKTPRPDVKNTVEALAYIKDHNAEVREICGISRQAVMQWHRVPAEHCPALERALGIPRVILRPDVYA